MKTNENKSRMTKKDITYVSRDSKSFISDAAFQAMNAETRGVYCTLIFYLYANGGSIVFDAETLGRLCNCDDFDKVWEKIKSRFKKRKDKIFHNKVSKELSRTLKLTQARREAGLKGANARWQSQSQPNAKRSEAKRNEEKVREFIPTRSINKPSGFSKAINKVVQNSKRNSPQNSSSSSNRIASPEIKIQKLNLYDRLCRKLRAYGPANQATFRNFVNWLGDSVTAGKFDSEKIWKRVEDMAVDSMKGQVRNPPAVFISKVKSELGYLKDE